MEKENDAWSSLRAGKGVVVNNKVILNLVQALQRRCLAFVNGTPGRDQIKFGMTPFFNQPGFTLIELLVVVLIIGILAAVALPQYQLAVAKARVNRILPLIKSIENAQEVYKMANGNYADDFALLDVEMPTSNNDIWCYPVPGSQYRSIDCGDRKYSLILEKYYSGSLYCWAGTNEIAQKLCKYLCQTNVLEERNQCRISL